VERIARFSWVGSERVFVDEELVIYDDGSAWLVIRGPREQRGPIGTNRAELGAEDLAAVSEFEGKEVVFHLAADGPPSSSEDPHARQLAERIASLCREVPVSLAIFHVLPSGPPAAGKLNIALVAIGGGERPAQFELQSTNCSVHFHAGREELGWRECPSFPTGFVTAEAVGLGGIGRPAGIEPGSHGVIAFSVETVEGATSISMRVAGWLRAALPDAEEPARFSTYTDARNIER
jgi:hypothetical protein